MRKRKSPYKKGPNAAEFQLEELFDQQKIKFTRRGYPDYTVIKQNKIIGFIEVKPRDEPLKPAQKMFAELCKSYGIPFVRWIPGEPLPDWV